MIEIRFTCDRCGTAKEVTVDAGRGAAVAPVDWCDWGGVQLCPVHAQQVNYPSRERMNRAVGN